jgi:hypothetical protein
MRKLLIKLFGLHPKKCYVLTQSSGSWDGIDAWVAGIYFDKSEAEKYQKILLEQMEEAKNVPPPFESEDGLTEEELSIYNRWWNKNNDAHELNAPVIREYFIN